MAALTVSIVSASIVLQACGADDITFQAKVINNSPNAVVDRQCNITCNRFFTRVVLRPGQSTNDNESPDGVQEPDRITSLSGKVLGCLPFRFANVPSAQVAVKISQMVPCGESDGTDKTHGHDWPNRDN